MSPARKPPLRLHSLVAMPFQLDGLSINVKHVSARLLQIRLYRAAARCCYCNRTQFRAQARTYNWINRTIHQLFSLRCTSTSFAVARRALSAFQIEFIYWKLKGRENRGNEKWKMNEPAERRRGRRDEKGRKSLLSGRWYSIVAELRAWKWNPNKHRFAFSVYNFLCRISVFEFFFFFSINCKNCELLTIYERS